MYNPDLCHNDILQQKPLMAFDAVKDYQTQAKAIKEKIMECLGDVPQKVALEPVVEATEEHETYMEYRVRFNTEKDNQAISILCIPKKASKEHPVPLAVCVQGHGTGMHVSMGRKIYPSDHPEDGERDVAIQALERGYATISLDQRGMGERRTEAPGNFNPKEPDDGEPRCNHTAMNALLLGRTLLGERCFDISCAIDLALTYPEIDPERILCTGNSGGGTATYYAACYDERIKVAMPSCAVCTFKDSIGAMMHCPCNYVPGLGKYLDMGDMAAAIAPRALVVINGLKDPIFPKNGVDETAETIRAIYEAAGVPDRFINVTGEGGHRYYKERAWYGFEQVTKGSFDC